MATPGSQLQNPSVGSAPSQGQVSNIIDLLFQEGKMTADQVQKMKFEAINTSKPMETIVIEKGIVTPDDLAAIKAKSYNMDFVDLRKISISPELLQKLPKNIALKNLAIVYEENGNVIKIAMADPLDLQTVKYLQTLVGRSVKPAFAAATTIREIIDTRYGAQVGAEVEEALEEVEDVVSIDTSEAATGDLSQISSAPVSRIVSMILEYGVKYKASDIHIEPQEGRLSVRFRIDGVMSEKLSLPRKLIPSIVSRIKILADLKIDEHRIPQDGRFQIKVDTRVIDIRVSVMPAIYGEKVVMRLLEKGKNVLALEKTGLRGPGYKSYINSLSNTQGIILITGPTGSGKTQTLASSIAIVNKPDVNIITLEDPVEIRINRVTQVQVNADVGLTFAKGLRSFLRQDPDIIMVGEIRDSETAELSIQASLTGHLVLSTLHTNSAAGALPRLFDMGIEPYLLASTINIVVGQRLVRTLCEHCKEAYEASPEVVNQIQGVLGTLQGYDIYKVVGAEDKVELFKSSGCPQCNNTGYSGRIGIFEIMPVTETIGQLVLGRKSTSEIHKLAVAEGMITMLQDGYMKALEGVTNIEEVLRVQNM